MEETYSHTTWRVKPGCEAEFERRWQEWAEWSQRQGLGAHARLLKDVENPQTYVSFGPWVSVELVSNWRSLAGYHERVARLRDVVDSFEPGTFEVVATR
jgi:heme-degrading monooxygenase HmoA